MPPVRANISFLLEIVNFKNVDLFQRGYYQFRYYLKSGTSNTPVTSYAKTTVAIFPPVLLSKSSSTDATDAFVDEGAVSQSPISPKACSKTVLILYHKESARFRDVFEQQVQVNVDATQIEDIFKSSELYLCTELWFSEEANGVPLNPTTLTCVSTRQFRVHLSPTRGLCHYFLVMFNYTHLCAVECIAYAFLTGILPGLTRAPAGSAALLTLASHEKLVAKNWKNVLFSTSSMTNRQSSAVAIHRHLCQALLSARERMLTLWHEISIFLPGGSQPTFDLMNFRSELGTITDRFQRLTTDDELERQIELDLAELGSENLARFKQIFELILSTSKVTKHLQRKSHQIRMKRFAEAFFVQELSISQLLAVYDPSTVGHETTANIVRLSPYFQKLPELPISSKEMDGDQTNLPIMFEDVYISNAATQQLETMIVNAEVEEEPVLSITRGSLFQMVQEANADSGLFHHGSSINGFYHKNNRIARSTSLFDCGCNDDMNATSAVSYFRAHRKSSKNRHRLFGRRFRLNNHAAESVIPSTEPQVNLVGYRRYGDNTLNGVSSGLQLVSDTSTNLFNHFIGQNVQHSSSMLSLSSADPDPPSKHRFDIFRRMTRNKSKVFQSTPDLQSSLVTLNNTSSLLYAHEINNFESVQRCRKCGLPYNNSFEKSDCGALLSSLSISLPALTNLDIANCDAQRLYDPKSGSWNRPSLRKFKWQRYSRHLKYFKHRSQISPNIYTDDLVRLGSCRDLREGGLDACCCPATLEKCSRVSVVQTYVSPATSLSVSGVRSLSDDMPPESTHRTYTVKMETSRRGQTSKPRRVCCRMAGNSQPTSESNDFDDDPVLITDAPHHQTAKGRGDKKNGEWMLNKSNICSTPSVENGNFPRRSLSTNFVSALATPEEGSSVKRIMENGCAAYSNGMALTPHNVTIPTSRSTDRLVEAFAPGTMAFVVQKEQMKKEVVPDFQGNVYSDFSQLAITFPYFTNPPLRSNDVHLIVCVHGLDGNCVDLRLVVVFLQLALPDCPIEFLMSESNHEDTYAGLDQLSDNLVDEVIHHIASMETKPVHISFIAHSLGCVLVRAALANHKLAHLLPQLHCFLSLCGPHLGTVYGSSGLVNVGMWALQKLKKSSSLLQLRLRDHADPRETYLYKLSSADGLNRFRYVLLVASPQDFYVPHHSSRIELCRASLQDTTEMGKVYMEMVTNLLQRIIKDARTTVVRYDINHAIQSGANHFIGRAAHIAVLDSEVLLEKFFCVSAAKYFRCDEKLPVVIRENLI